jgi:hypothetical protein
MSIKRDDLDAGRVDFAGVTTGKRLPLIHPGEILRDDFLRPLKISVYTLAQAIKVSRVAPVALRWQQPFRSIPGTARWAIPGIAIA